jgi:hypothetical protein
MAYLLEQEMVALGESWLDRHMRQSPPLAQKRVTRVRADNETRREYGGARGEAPDRTWTGAVAKRPDGRTDPIRRMGADESGSKVRDLVESGHGFVVLHKGRRRKRRKDDE